jgi:hypothetical protein
MAKVMVYRFETYDHFTRKMVHNSRWALRKTIEQSRPQLPTGFGFVIEGSGIEVDETVLDGEGMTPSGFNPYAEATCFLGTGAALPGM